MISRCCESYLVIIYYIEIAFIIMAIVKFVSDKVCNIFIDKEYVGEVNKDSILKLVLEPGGYLVEVRDEEAIVLKKYKLEIKATDNQILLDISEGTSSLDETIIQLRNDPSIEFYCNRASFRYNGLYGYVNKRFEVVIPAIYAVANKFKDNKAFVVREFNEGKKVTLIDEDGNMFFNRWFDYIGESDSTILLGVDNKVIVYSKMKYEKIAEYYNAGYDYVYPLVPVYKDKGEDEYYGFIDYNGEEFIPLLFERVGNFNNEGRADVYFWGRKASLTSGKVLSLHSSNYSEGERQITNEELAHVFVDYSYSVWSYNYEVSPIWDDDGWSIKIETYSLTSTYYRGERIGEEIIKCDRILYMWSGCCAYRFGNRCAVRLLPINLPSYAEKEYWFDYNYIIPIIISDGSGDGIYEDSFYYIEHCIVKDKGKYGVVDVKGSEIFPLVYDNIEGLLEYFRQDRIYVKLTKGKKHALANLSNKKLITSFELDNVTYLNDDENGNCAFLIEKDGKYGLLMNDILIPAIYDKVIYGKNKDTIIVIQNGKYGIIDCKGKEVLPLKYGEIVLLGDEYFKVKNDTGWSLGYLHHKIFYPHVYDDITLFSENEHEVTFINTFLVRVENYYGCINSKGEILVPIEFDKIELNSTFYCPRNFSFILYKNGKAGFCDVAYFSSDYIACKRTGSYLFEYVYIVSPQYDECILLRHPKSVLYTVDMHYAAVKKDGKWGILDQKPRKLTYSVNDVNLEDESEPNFIDLDFKYNSLEELKEKADCEFKRRYDKYYHPWRIKKDLNRDYCIVEEK